MEIFLIALFVLTIALSFRAERGYNRPVEDVTPAAQEPMERHPRPGYSHAGTRKLECPCGVQCVGGAMCNYIDTYENAAGDTYTVLV